MRSVFIFCLILLVYCKSNAQSALNRSHLEFNIGIGKRAYINSRDGMFRSMASLNYNYRINNVFYLKSGLDVNYYDIPFNGDYNAKGYILTSTSLEHFSYAWFLGAEIVMNKVIFQGGMSRYLYFKHLPQYDVNYYSKIGFKYLITPHLNFGFFLKAHSYEADYMDFGLGYKF